MACDFFTVDTIWLRRLQVLCFIELAVLREVGLHLASRSPRLAVVEVLTCTNRNGSQGRRLGWLPVFAGQAHLTEYC
jgi:hypothetical protein